MVKIVLYYTDGTNSQHLADRLDRDEVDQFLDDVAQGLGGVIVVDDGPLAVPATGDLRRVEVFGVKGDEWLAGREEVLTDDDLD